METAMISYTTTHSTGLTKTRKSKGHLKPIYTHAVWVDFGDGNRFNNWKGWHCRSIATEQTARYEAERYSKAGYPIELTTVTAA